MKVRSKPLMILILAALLRRLPKSHPCYPQIEEEYRRRMAGYHGEESLDYYLRSLPQQKYFILHDLNLQDGDFNCQIDTMIISSGCIYLIGVKHMAGELEFDTTLEQFKQTKDGETKGYGCPIAQEERHMVYMQKLLAALHFPPVSIDYLITLTNPYCSFKVTGQNAHKVRPHVCKSDIFLKRIQQFEQAYQTSCLTTKEMLKLSRLLLKMNTPPVKFVLEKYGVARADLRSGVQCPVQGCEFLPMVRTGQVWVCPKCGTVSKDAHIQAVADHFLLFGPTITNREFRAFTHLGGSIDVGGRMLRSLNLVCSGSRRMRVYSPEQFPWNPALRNTTLKQGVVLGATKSGTRVGNQGKTGARDGARAGAGAQIDGRNAQIKQ
jgi:hypothetical protein